ncbi:hypothetical protein BH11CYA1_BH11CYA1_01490 [soil metagenome]
MFLVIFLSIIYLCLAGSVFLATIDFLDHGFVFVDDRYQNLATILVCAMPLLLAAMLTRLPQSTFKACMNCWLIPAAFCSVLVITAILVPLVLNLPIPSNCVPEPTMRVNGEGIRLIHNYYASKVDENDSSCVLRLEREIFSNILVEYKTLASVDPAQGATIELVDKGTKVKLLVPYHYSLLPFTRVFSTDWNANISKPCIKLHRTY